MDFDTAKENIQPLRHGRRADRLEAALETNKEQIELEKKEHEEAVRNYDGPDPLAPWFELISFIEQSYPSSGAESGLDAVVTKCILAFEHDERYRQDRRMIKLFIKYIDTQNEPQECYAKLYSNGIGTLVADLYIAWSYYYDAANNFKQAEAIFQKGFDAGAQPAEDLKQAHIAFSVSMSQRMLYDDDSSKQQFQEKMKEKRSVLTTLRAHKKKYVGSVRTGIAVRDENPGVVNQENQPMNSNAKQMDVHEDEDQAAAAVLPANTSVIRSIVDFSRQKEDTHEPGPWNKAKFGKNGNVFGKSASGSNPRTFDIPEDDEILPIPCIENLYEKGIQLPSNWVSKNEPQKPWDIPIFVEEPMVQRAFPCYEKFLLYPNTKTEISPEEYRAYKWFKDRGMRAKITEQYEHLWTNTAEAGARIPPGFARSNVQEKDDGKIPVRHLSEEDSQFQLPLEKMYPECGEVLSFEELRAERFKRGEIKICTEEDFEEIDDDAMEMTMIGDRRHSIFPASRKSIVPRKSVMPRKSMMPPPSPVREEDEEEDQSVQEVFVQATGAIRKRKSQETKHELMAKREFVSDTPPRSSFASENVFKPPAPPLERKSAIRPYPFEIPEDDDGANETCSTHQFNFFLKAQSVSTPVSKKNAPKVEPEVPVVTEEKQADISRFSEVAVMPKQLSTIMETTENTHSTKSSVSSHYETDLHPKTLFSQTELITHSSLEQQAVQQEIEKRFFMPVLDNIRIPEDQTETCATVPLQKLTQNNVTEPKLMISMLDYKFDEPPFVAFSNDDECVKPTSFMVLPSNMTELNIPESPEDDESSSAREVDRTKVPGTQEQEVLSPKSNVSESTLISEARSSENTKQSIKESETSLQNHSIGESPNFEVPETQDTSRSVSSQPSQNSISKTEDDFKIPVFEDSNILVPETQAYELPAARKASESEENEIPASQDDLEIAETQKVEAKKPEAAQLNASISFNIYEDTLMEPLPAKPKTPEKFLADDEGTGFLHMSRKENLALQPPESVKKQTVFDEFLQLLDSPQPNVIRTLKVSAPVANKSKDNVSDLLKFSGVGGSLETSFKQLSVDQPKCKTPTNFFDDDLNTEKFSLGNLKNSTLLVDTASKEPLSAFNDDFNLSIAFEPEELKRLQASEEPPVESPPTFKVPELPTIKLPKPANVIFPRNPLAFKCFEDSEDDEDASDLSKSIYVEKTPAPAVTDEDWSNDNMASFIADVFNQYEHKDVDESLNLSTKVVEAIFDSDGNPFHSGLREAVLEYCVFTNYLENYRKDTCTLVAKLPQTRVNSIVICGEQKFQVEKLLAKGGFAKVYLAKNTETGRLVAMKQENPACLFEYYVIVELHHRLKNENMKAAFMNIEYSAIGNNASIFVYAYSKYGTILDMCKTYRNLSGKNIDEYVVMVLTSQLISIIDYLHGCRIIHGDIKPDNFLMMNKIEYGAKTPCLKLIDFGSAIDMDVYKNNETFTYVVNTENFTCCEMKDKKPWTYQIDLFGLAGTAFAMLFGRYMEVEKIVNVWGPKVKYPRYIDKSLWEDFFYTLLNVQSCSLMPNLQILKTVFVEKIADKERYVIEKINEFNRAF